MSDTSDLIRRMEELALRYRAHIAKIGVDFPEARAARREELHYLHLAIAEARATQKGEDDGRA